MLRASPERLFCFGNLLVIPFQAHELRQRGIASMMKAAHIRSEGRPALFLGEARKNFDALMIRLPPGCGTEHRKFIRDLRLLR